MAIDACVLKEGRRFKPAVVDVLGTEHVSGRDYDTLTEGLAAIRSMLDRPSRMLCRVGEALYGDRWQRAVAREVDVSDRAVRYWASDAVAPPHEINDELMRMVTDRIWELRDCTQSLMDIGCYVSPELAPLLEARRQR